MAAAGALSAEDARVCPEDFEIRNVLGKGGFGKVFLVYSQIFAMQALNIRKDINLYSQ